MVVGQVLYNRSDACVTINEDCRLGGLTRRQAADMALI